MPRPLAIAATALAGWLCAHAAAQDLHARPTLVPEQMTAKPGNALWIAIDFELDDGWHTYWPGANDTGLALDVEIECSPQAEPGELVWPAPHRHSPSEGILDHIFEEHMTVLLPIAVAEDAEPGDSIEITLDMRWLACRSACVLESAERSITIPIADAIGKPSRQTAAVFERARARLPQPPTDRDPLRITFADSRLTLRSNDAEAMAFYPYEDSRPPRDLLVQGQADGDTLTVEFREGDQPIRGVLEVWSTPTESKVFAIEWPPMNDTHKPPAATDRRDDR